MPVGRVFGTIICVATAVTAILMRSRTTLIVLGLIAAGVAVVYFGDESEDAAIVEALQRKQIESRASASAEATRPEFHPTSWDLGDDLRASKNAARETWFVEHQESDTLVQLPFPPQTSGEFPGRTASGESTPESGHGDEAAGRGEGFVGADACAKCHRKNHSGFIKTAHHRTSGPAESDRIQGTFVGPGSQLTSRSRPLAFELHARGDRFHQTVRVKDWKLEVPMDVYTGTAKTGQSFLYWLDDGLYQAYISYGRKMNEWIPSPGYNSEMVDFARPIKAVCLECHMTYVQRKRPPNFYHRETAIWGISCERCHGPGEQHILFHESNPNAEAKHITHPQDLARERQLDICAQCHSGLFEILQKPFAFRPGDELNRFHREEDPDSDGIGGIHTSNQLTRLRKSRCFTESDMTCTTCHDPHRHERGDVAKFSRDCIVCHQREHCGMSDRLGDRIEQNCIACHMPVVDNDDIVLLGSRGNFTMKMVDHHIRVDRESTERYMKSLPGESSGVRVTD